MLYAGWRGLACFVAGDECLTAKQASPHFLFHVTIFQIIMITSENKILSAASDIFYHNGYHGTTMRDIAKTAGVNLALLHYYFKSKDALFKKVFLQAFSVYFDKAIAILNSDMDILEKIESVIAFYAKTTLKHPGLLVFILQETTANPSLKPIIGEYVKQRNLNKSFLRFCVEIRRAIRENRIKEIHPSHLYLDILSLSVFPEMLKQQFSRNGGFNQSANNRKLHVISTIFDGIKKSAP